jgi:putative membrane protein
VKRRHPLVTTLLRWGINALGIFVAAEIIPGISFRDGKSLAIVVVVLGLFNAFLKPALVLFALPFVIMTLGVGILFINALLLLLAAEIVPGFGVDGFFAAFLAALVIGVINLFLGSLVGDSPLHVAARRRGAMPPHEEARREPVAKIHRRDRDNEDVIDI